MPYQVRRIVAVAALGLLVASTALAQTKSGTTTETKRFEVISVDGNMLVVRGPEGTRELTVPEDFKFTVNGQPMSVHDSEARHERNRDHHDDDHGQAGLRDRGEERHRDESSGNHILVKTEQGMKNFTQGDIDKRGVKIIKDGQPVQISDFTRATCCRRRSSRRSRHR